MATNTAQLASLVERANTARPATNASLPILSPPHQPTPMTFAPAPVLSPAQRAVLTRQQRAAGIIPPKPETGAAKVAPVIRPDGVTLKMTIAMAGGSKNVLEVVFGHRVAEGTKGPIPESEAGFCNITALCALRTTGDQAGEFMPANQLVFSGVATADELASVLPHMRRATGALLTAYTETEDVSFPQMVLTLAGLFRVDVIEFVNPKTGQTVTAKRGAAYIAAFKASEAFKPAE